MRSSPHPLSRTPNSSNISRIPAVSPTQHPILITTTIARLPTTLCLIQLLGAFLDAFATRWWIESIIISGPLLTLLGLVIAWLATRLGLLRLLMFGLWHPLTTAAFALTIAAFRWGPGAAKGPGATLAFVSAAVLLGLVGFVLADIRRLSNRRTGWPSPGIPSDHARPAVRFSMRALLITTTIACLLLAFAASLTWEPPWPFFAIYGLAVLTASFLLIARFVQERGARR